MVERIDEHGIGFVIERWEDIARVASDRAAIAAATKRCLAVRDQFTNEASAKRIRAFVEPLLAARVAA